jgi:hypothetical protein
VELVWGEKTGEEVFVVELKSGKDGGHVVFLIFEFRFLIWENVMRDPPSL